MADEDTNEGAPEELVIVFEGTHTQAEVLHTMLRARGIPSTVTREHEIEGAMATEAQIRVPPGSADEARALIAASS
jgi:hypothetical protein